MTGPYRGFQTLGEVVVAGTFLLISGSRLIMAEVFNTGGEISDAGHELHSDKASTDQAFIHECRVKLTEGCAL